MTVKDLNVTVLQFKTAQHAAEFHTPVPIMETGDVISGAQSFQES
jgi:hypothetical protein